MVVCLVHLVYLVYLVSRFVGIGNTNNTQEEPTRRVTFHASRPAHSPPGRAGRGDIRESEDRSSATIPA